MKKKPGTFDNQIQDLRQTAGVYEVWAKDGRETIDARSNAREMAHSFRAAIAVLRACENVQIAVFTPYMAEIRDFDKRTVSLARAILRARKISERRGKYGII